MSCKFFFHFWIILDFKTMKLTFMPKEKLTKT